MKQRDRLLWEYANLQNSLSAITLDKPFCETECQSPIGTNYFC